MFLHIHSEVVDHNLNNKTNMYHVLCIEVALHSLSSKLVWTIRAATTFRTRIKTNVDVEQGKAANPDIWTI